MEKIRVLRIITRMNLGGPAIQISGLASNLDPSRFNHLVVTGECESDEMEYPICDSENIQIKRISSLRKSINILFDLRAFIEIRRVIAEFNPHIIHTHTTKAGVIGRLASITFKNKHKRVHTFHGHLLEGYFSPVFKLGITSIEKLLATRTDVLISVGRKVRNDLIQAGVGSADKYQVVPPGLSISVTLSRDDARSMLNLRDGVTYFAWIGRVVAIKNPMKLLAIAAVVKTFDLPIRFCVVGDGPLQNEMIQLSVLQDLPIDFLGWQVDIENVLAAIDCVILTSINEGTPLSLIQAQMAGKAVISTNVGSVEEIVQNDVSGFVGEFDEVEFASIIRRLGLDTSLRIKMGNAGIDFTKSKFSVARLTEDHEKIYINLLTQPARGPQL
jgi:glycosyltransferase involved in cell wall biosynthesis